jgi:hypothetical protein
MTSFLLSAAAAAICSVASPPHTVALVELYTSQGCSSCPPADRWLSTLSAPAAAERVVPLALHVGYWDYIGWKDPFARRDFNERQRRLAEANGSRSVYTPGVFVQGRETPGWSDARAFESTIDAIVRRAPRATIRLSGAVEAATVEIRATADTKVAGARLYVALAQSGIGTAVSAGENRGATLRNDHVVREWSGARPIRGEPAVLRWALPAGAPIGQLAVVSFVEDVARAEVLQALRLPLAGCSLDDRGRR